MISRLRWWRHELWVAADVMAQVALFGLLHVLVAADRPRRGETISSRVGRYALAGAPWALVAERAIDALMQLPPFNEPPGHCRRNIIPVLPNF